MKHNPVIAGPENKSMSMVNVCAVCVCVCILWTALVPVWSFKFGGLRTRVDLELVVFRFLSFDLPEHESRR